MRARLAALVAAVAVVGCGGPKSFDDFRHQLDARWCDYQVRCGAVAAGARRFCGVPPMLATLAASGIDVGGAVRRGSMQFHPGNAQDCLDAVAHASCDPRQAAISLGRACHGIGSALLPAGRACLGGDECQGGACVAGSCVAWAATGAACLGSTSDPRQACDPTVHYCDGVCKKKQQPGDRCAADVECAFDLVCVDGKCGDPPELGDGAVCSPDTPPCRDGLFCDVTGSCGARRDRGQSCAAAAATECRDGLVCIAGACASWLDLGAACAQPPDHPSLTGCPQSASCTAGSCQPAPSLPNGPDQPCGGGGGGCADGLRCASGVCVYLATLGGDCADDAGCAAGLRCDHASGSCVFMLPAAR